jgi:RNA polymerase sigma-70 factor (ECF subfamily)
MDPVQAIDPSGVPSEPDEAALLAALRAGDERVFEALVVRYQGSMLRLARTYVSDPAVAEEVVQEAWLGALRGLARFEARASLRTWLFRILTNTAKTRAVREARTVPFSALGGLEETAEEPAVEPERFLAADHPRWPGHWSAPLRAWEDPEARLLSGEVRARLQAAIEALPGGQRAVITLRDVEGWPPTEVCNILAISETNQRVLLHRARSRVRRALEAYFEEGRAPE